MFITIIIVVLFFDIFALITDCNDEDLIETANHDPVDAYDVNEHNYDDKSL